MFYKTLVFLRIYLLKLQYYTRIIILGFFLCKSLLTKPLVELTHPHTQAYIAHVALKGK